MALRRPSAPHLVDPSTRRWRGVSPGPRPCVHSAASAHYKLVAWATSHWQPPSAEATPRRRRGGDESSRRRRQGGVPVHLALGGAPLPSWPSAGHQQRQKKARGDGVGRRRPLPTTKTSAPPRGRRLAAALWFQSQRGNGTAVAHARRHKHCSTAAATTAGVAHRSLHRTRDASAALS